jgi:tRNA nucleotidyltransferase (CCA-adding enzyme)
VPEPMASQDPAEIERRVLDRIRPRPEMLARVARVRVELVERVMQAAGERKSPLVRALVAGSAARETFLEDRLDFDLFLLFPPELSKDQLEADGLALGRAVLTDPETRYAEHPYLRGTFEGFQVDAVPGYAITDSAHPLSAVDRTPFHQAYLVARQTPAMIDQVRLTKKFLRCLGLYGSETRTEGFSGYLQELLVLRYGSLRGLQEEARRWRPPVHLSESGKDPPRLPSHVALILPDPVDPNRNVASALSQRNLATFILAAEAYLRNPSERWFEGAARPSITIEQALERLRARTTHVAVVSLPRPDLVDDILYPQIRKAEHAIAEEAERQGFEVMGTASAAGDASLVLLVEVTQLLLPAVKLHEGPPVGIDRVGNFLEKWTDPSGPTLQGPYVQADGRLAVETRRAERDLVALLRTSLARLPLGKDLRASSATNASVSKLEGADDTPALRVALGDLLLKRLPWLP